jgi:hypothetical protein
MPTYKFKNLDTEEEYEIFMSISQRDLFLKENPNIEQQINGFPGMVDPTRIGRVSPDDNFKDVLKEVKKNNPGSKINTW